MASVFKNIEEIYKKIKTIRKENSNKAIIATIKSKIKKLRKSESLKIRKSEKSKRLKKLKDR